MIGAEDLATRTRVSSPPTTSRTLLQRPSNTLGQVKIASPCSASWEEMKGDERVRFCDHCQLNVYNLSGMDRREATRLVTGQEERLCVRFYQRFDGTVLTADCPVGLRAARKRLARSITCTAVILLSVRAYFVGEARSDVLPRPIQAVVNYIDPPARPTMGAPAAIPAPEMLGQIRDWNPPAR